MTLLMNNDLDQLQPGTVETFVNGANVAQHKLSPKPATVGQNGEHVQHTFRLASHPVENHRPLKVIVIGAGYSGIYLAIRIPERLRNVELTIYEKNSGIGGTWWENRYAGAACDIASHSYQYKFEPNPSWSSFYAPSWEIRDYLNKVADKYGAKSLKKWRVQIEDTVNGKIIEDESDIVVSARGLLNTINWPEIPGLNTFKGELMHSATWNESYDFSSKRIGVIGSGSSAIQIIPQLQKVPEAKLSCFIRGRTWISPTISQNVWDRLEIPKAVDFTIANETRERIENEEDYWYKLRIAIEEDLGSMHGSYFKGHPVAVEGEQAFRKQMIERLGHRQDIFDALIPSFRPGCRRLTPGPGFLEALTKENVSFLTTPIVSISEDGVNLEDGTHVELDCLVCATGFQPSEAPPFEVKGLHGATLSEQWKDRPRSYLSLACADMPNFFMMLGPNGATGSGSLTTMMEATGDYICRAIRKMQKEDVAVMVPKRRAVQTFMDYVDAYFEPTVFMDECRSWYKKHGKMIALWPGSSLHLLEVLRTPRWEDFDYEYLDNGRAAGGWLGNGWSELQNAEGVGGRHLAYFLYPEFVIQPPAGRPEQALEEGGRYSIRPFA